MLQFGPMTVEQAAQVVLGTKPTSHNELEHARATMFLASHKGYKFSIDHQRGSASDPCIVVTKPGA